MTSTQPKRQKLATSSGGDSSSTDQKDATSRSALLLDPMASDTERTERRSGSNGQQPFGVDVDDLTDDTDSDADNNDDDDDDDDDDDECNEDDGRRQANADIQEQLAAAGPAGVAAAAAIATARKRKRPHTFETNPSVRKRQQTRLIRKLRACIDEYTMRVGQQAVVLITMPGKTAHNFKVFGAQPLESVIRACKQEIMGELEQALREQAPLQQLKDDANKHELPPLVIDGIPTPVEKMTQAQLRAFIPLMLKYSTGRGKPGWGKESTRPPWWPETLPWANVRSDARDDNEKQRISWTTTLRQIVTNCYKYHGRDDLLPIFDGSEVHDEDDDEVGGHDYGEESERPNGPRRSGLSSRPLGSSRLGSARSQHQHQQQQQQQQQQLYASSGAYAPANFLHTISNGDGTVSLVQVDPANAQILTLPDGTQVRAVRLQALGGEHQLVAGGDQLAGLGEATTIEINQANGQAQQLAITEANLASDGQIIVTGEDGTQSCYPMSSLVSIPASVYQQFAQSGQPISIVTEAGDALQAVSVETSDSGAIGGVIMEHQQVEHQSAASSAGQEVEIKSEGPSTRSRTADKQTDSTDTKQRANGHNNNS